MDGHAAGVFEDGHGGSANGREFIGPPNRCKRAAGFSERSLQQRRELDKASAADDGIDEAGQEREKAEENNFHRRQLTVTARR